MTKGRFARLFTLTVLYGVASLTALFMFLVRPGMTGHPQADFPDLVHGQADKPYVARAALPITVRILSAATPQTFKDSCHRQLSGRQIVRAFRWYDEYLYEFALATLLMLLCLVGFTFTLRALTELYYDFPPVLNDLSPLVGLALLPLFFRYYSYLYDPGTLLLFTLSLLLLARRRFVWFIVAFALATLNKETSILLVALYACNEWITTRRIPLTRAALLAVVWIAVRAALVYAFRDNPGGYFEDHFREHTIWLLTKFPVATRYTLVVAALFFVFIRHDWRAKPRFLRIGLGVTLIPLFLASLFFGFADELRGYYEVFPFLYLLAVPSIFRFLGRAGD